MGRFGPSRTPSSPVVSPRVLGRRRKGEGEEESGRTSTSDLDFWSRSSSVLKGSGLLRDPRWVGEDRPGTVYFLGVPESLRSGSTNVSETNPHLSFPPTYKVYNYLRGIVSRSGGRVRRNKPRDPLPFLYLND